MDIAIRPLLGSDARSQGLATRVVEQLLRSGDVTAEAVLEAVGNLTAAEQSRLLTALLPWSKEVCVGFDGKTRARLLTSELSGSPPPFVSRFTHRLTLWRDDPDWMTEPDDEEPAKPGEPVFEIGDGEGGAVEEENPRPPDSAPVSERLRWLDTEARRKKRDLDGLLIRLQLETVLLAFFWGSTTGGEVVRRAELDAFEQSMRAGGMESGWRRRVLDRLMQAIRAGDAGAVKFLLSKHGWLRRKVLWFLLKRFHLIGAILATIDLLPILHDWWSAWQCWSRLEELDILRWEWMVEAGISVQPGESAQLGPYVNPGGLGLPAGTPCEHSVTYLFVWEDESGEEHEEVLAGPRPLQVPGDDHDDLPEGALTDSESLPSPEIPEGFARGYIVYEFVTRCPGREPIVTRLFAVAVFKPAGLGPF